MSKRKNYFVCTACGADYSKWNGRCEACGEWNTIIERTEEMQQKKTRASAVLLSSVEMQDLSRRLTGIGEFALVCGGRRA